MCLHPRLAQRDLREALADTPVIYLAGARQVGKTTLARDLLKTYAFASLDDSMLAEAARTDPAGFLDSYPPRLVIDEVQRAPALLQAIKLRVDRD